jgi:hypothetical protein
MKKNQVVWGMVAVAAIVLFGAAVLYGQMHKDFGNFPIGMGTGFSLGLIAANASSRLRGENRDDRTEV